jgi:hypothetical protein
MDSAAVFPLHLPGDARRPFGSDEVARRFGAVAGLRTGARVLELWCGPSAASLVLAQERRCSVVAADSDARSVASLRERVKALGLVDRVEVRQVEPGALPWADGEFQAVLVQGPLLGSLSTAAGTLRRLLGMDGRLGLTYTARVGRHPARKALELWERRLGAPLQPPRELLQVLEGAGFEPEAAEALVDWELDALYRDWEARLPVVTGTEGAPVRAEVVLHRELKGPSGVSYVFLVGRRKEPGEKPPVSRDSG